MKLDVNTKFDVAMKASYIMIENIIKAKPHPVLVPFVNGNTPDKDKAGHHETSVLHRQIR